MTVPTTSRVDEIEECLLAVGVLDHQMKTDATVVHGWASTLDDHWDDLTDEQRRSAVAVIRRRSASLAEAARQALSATAAGWPAEPRPRRSRREANLAERVRAVTEELATATETHFVRYEGPRSLMCRVDPDPIERAISQLVENSVKYSREGSPIVVSLRRDDLARRVSIDVVDEGIGVPADDHLFDPFVRGTSSDDGSGLGLYMVRRSVESVGGAVSARRNPRWGSTFHIEVPLA